VSSAIEISFPNLKESGYSITSPEDISYNCIAWAAHDTERWWWPSSLYYWPDHVPREETLESFVQAYATLGFVPIQDAGLELGHEKIAIFINSSGTPTHAARQLPNGAWTSKLGRREDIEHHTIHGIEGSAYGTVAAILARPI
jgi:hypothetical protein